MTTLCAVVFFTSGFFSSCHSGAANKEALIADSIRKADSIARENFIADSIAKVEKYEKDYKDAKKKWEGMFSWTDEDEIGFVEVKLKMAKDSIYFTGKMYNGENAEGSCLSYDVTGHVVDDMLILECRNGLYEFFNYDINEMDTEKKPNIKSFISKESGLYKLHTKDMSMTDQTYEVKHSKK